MARVCWWCFSKAFFILCKKPEQITFLHVYHVLEPMGWSQMCATGSSSLSPKGPFVATAAPSYNLFTECPFPDGLDMAVLLHTFSVIGLFLNCYHQTYLKSKQEKQTYRGWTQGLKLAEPSPQRVARRQRAPQPTRAEQIPLGLHFIL